MKTFRKELEILINKKSMENGSNTPDFILAEFLNQCLKAFDKAVNERNKWDSSEAKMDVKPINTGLETIRSLK